MARIIFRKLYRECETAKQFSDELQFQLREIDEEERREIVSTKNRKSGCPPLFVACENGMRVEAIEYLIKFCKADIEQRGFYYKYNVTPLWVAAARGKLAIVKCLIELGADINSLSDDDFTTPTKIARVMNNNEIVNFLMKNGSII